MQRILVVGAGLAGMRVLAGLRDGGYAGELVLLGAEAHLPYDRPPLSKQVLLGRDPVLLADAARLAELRVDARFGGPATVLDPSETEVHLADGSRVAGDAVVVCTGASPRPLPVPGGERARTLRTRDDALDLRAALVPGARLVVVGAGFIGCEVAASARSLGVDVTIVEPLPTPLARSLGAAVGTRMAAVHEAAGVRLLCGGAAVTEVTPDAVRLGDGTILPADVVVAGIGVLPDTAWVGGSGVEVEDGVVCDAQGRTSRPGVWAAGDVARWENPFYGRHIRVEHWTSAAAQGTAVAAAILGATLPDPDLPYVWSDQHGLKLQALGLPAVDDTVHIVADPDRPPRFTAIFARDGVVTAVVGLGMAKQVMRLRPHLLARAALADVVDELEGSVHA